METAKEVGFLLLIAAALAPMVLGIGWGIVEHNILPRFIPRHEIKRLVEDIKSRYPHDPVDAARNEEMAAWYRSEAVAQGKWRRVRQQLELMGRSPARATKRKLL